MAQPLRGGAISDGVPSFLRSEGVPYQSSAYSAPLSFARSYGSFLSLERDLLLAMEELGRCAMPGASSQNFSTCIMDLGNDALQEVFKHLPFSDRWVSLPRVCRRFAEVCRMAGIMWGEVSFGGSDHISLVKLFRCLDCRRCESVRSVDVTLYLQPSVRGSGVLGLTMAALLPGLVHLQLYGCCHADDVAHLSALTSLESLTLRKVTGPCWSDSIQCLRVLTRLNRLELSFSQSSTLTSRTLVGGFPEGLCDLTALTHLSLSVIGFRGSIAMLPPYVGRLTALTHLALVGFDLQRLCPELGSLTSLRSLDLSSSKLSGANAFPAQLSALQRVTELNLHIGFQGPFPHPLRSLTSLRKLNVAYNSQGMWNSFSFLSCFRELEELDLSFNYVSAWPRVISCMTSLRRLDVHINDLTCLAPGPYLAGLTHLRISHNRFDRLPGVLFEAMRLEVLNFSHQKTSEPVRVPSRLLLHLLMLPSLREATISKAALVEASPGWGHCNAAGGSASTAVVPEEGPALLPLRSGGGGGGLGAGLFGGGAAVDGRGRQQWPGPRPGPCRELAVAAAAAAAAGPLVPHRGPAAAAAAAAAAGPLVSGSSFVNNSRSRLPLPPPPLAVAQGPLAAPACVLLAGADAGANAGQPGANAQPQQQGQGQGMSAAPLLPLPLFSQQPSPQQLQQEGAGADDDVIGPGFEVDDDTIGPGSGAMRLVPIELFARVGLPPRLRQKLFLYEDRGF